MGGVGCVLLILFLKEPRKSAPIRQQLKRIDYLGELELSVMSHSVLILLLTFHFPGTMSLLTFATLVLVALNLGGIQYPWNSVPVLVCLIIGIFFLFVTVVIELRFAKEPMIPMHLFKKRTVLSVCVTGLFFGAAFAALIIELPLFLQVQRKLLVFMYRTITHYLCI